MEGGKRVAVGKREEGTKERNVSGQKGHGFFFFWIFNVFFGHPVPLTCSNPPPGPTKA